jgi:hypothetical protein
MKCEPDPEGSSAHMSTTRSSRPRVGIVVAALLLVTAVSCTAPPPDPGVAAPVVTAQPATGAGVSVRWSAVPGAAGYQVAATDQAGGAVTTASCFACQRLVVRGLVLLHFYDITVTPVDLAGAPIGPAGSTVSATYFDLPPVGLSSLTAELAPGDQNLVVTWQYADVGIAADRLYLQLDLVDDLGGRQPAAATLIYRNVEPDRYVIPVPTGRWLVRGLPVNSAGFAWESLTPPVMVENSCTGADLCAHVSTDDVEPLDQVAQGFLHGLVDEASGEQLSSDRVTPLDPKQWRLSGVVADESSRRFDVARTQILSDLWHAATATDNNGYARTPWSDWQAWRDFVTDTVATATAEGWAPDYWDVWNEPNGVCCPAFRPEDVPTATTERWLQTYEEAWRAIKAADPGAKVIGPSTTALQWTGDHWPDPAPEFDLDTFLRYAADHDLVWDAVSWHESGLQPINGDISYSIANVTRHLELAQAVIARHPGTVVDGRIFVNEYGAPEVHVLPGWAVAYFRALEDGGASAANRSCWNDFECIKLGFGGLQWYDGETTGLWWAHRFYADLGGLSRMAVASSSSWQFDGLAARDDAGQSVRVLLGRHWWCNQAVNAWCPFEAGIAPASLGVTIEWPYGTAPVQVTVERVPAGINGVPAPTAVSSDVVTPEGGTLAVTIPSVSDGDAISIVATVT